MLGLVSQGMGGNHNGVTVGFWSMIEVAASAGRDGAVRVHEYWQQQRRLLQPPA